MTYRNPVVPGIHRDRQRRLFDDEEA